MKHFAMLSILVLAGCGGHKLEGTWEGEIQFEKVPVKAAYTFTPDERFTASFRISTHGYELELTEAGLWKLDGRSLELNYADVTMHAFGPSPRVCEYIEQLYNGRRDVILSNANHDRIMKVRWVTNDHIRCAADTQIVDFVRAR